MTILFLVGGIKMDYQCHTFSSAYIYSISVWSVGVHVVNVGLCILLSVWIVRTDSDTISRLLFQSPEEHEAETKIKSKEARKYIFNCLEDIGQVSASVCFLQGRWGIADTEIRNLCRPPPPSPPPPSPRSPLPPCGSSGLSKVPSV